MNKVLIVFLFVLCLSFQKITCIAKASLTENEKENLLYIVRGADSNKKANQLAEFIQGKDELTEFIVLPQLVEAYAETGKYQLAVEYTTKMLHLAEKFNEHWNYGNAIHIGNVVRGLDALNNSDIANAKLFLLAAGNAPKSPQLCLFGPTMMLAYALLKENEYETVIAYLNAIKAIWTSDEHKVDSWILAIKKQIIPDFGLNLSPTFKYTKISLREN